MEGQGKTAPLFWSSGDLLADRRYGFAMDLAARGDRQGAVHLLSQTLEMTPGFASAWFALGDLREQLGDRPGAIAAFRSAQRTDPQDRQGAGLRLIRLGVDAPDAMPSGYVRSLFDQYAPRFDAALESLAYRAPQLLLDAIKQVCHGRGQRLWFDAVLDLGCGTGLAGATLRPFSDWLVGVDLSPAMIAKAGAKRFYDRLEVADIGTFMAAERDAAAQYHLILAADVLPYVGDLGAIMAAAASLLTTAGLFGFTLETHAGAGVVLGPKLRYAHSEAHVREAIAAAGLAVQSLLHASTRQEGGVPVPGLIVIAR